eukprot:4752172-Pyramimonas_sp.AAC.1
MSIQCGSLQAFRLRVNSKNMSTRASPPNPNSCSRPLCSAGFVSFRFATRPCWLQRSTRTLQKGPLRPLQAVLSLKNSILLPILCGI